MNSLLKNTPRSETWKGEWGEKLPRKKCEEKLSLPRAFPTTENEEKEKEKEKEKEAPMEEKAPIKPIMEENSQKPKVIFILKREIAPSERYYPKYCIIFFLFSFIV